MSLRIPTCRDEAIPVCVAPRLAAHLTGSSLATCWAGGLLFLLGSDPAAEVTTVVL